MRYITLLLILSIVGRSLGESCQDLLKDDDDSDSSDDDDDDDDDRRREISDGFGPHFQRSQRSLPDEIKNILPDSAEKTSGCQFDISTQQLHRDRDTLRKLMKKGYRVCLGCDANNCDKVKVCNEKSVCVSGQVTDAGFQQYPWFGCCRQDGNRCHNRNQKVSIGNQQANYHLMTCNGPLCNAGDHAYSQHLELLMKLLGLPYNVVKTTTAKPTTITPTTLSATFTTAKPITAGPANITLTTKSIRAKTTTSISKQGNSLKKTTSLATKNSTTTSTRLPTTFTAAAKPTATNLTQTTQIPTTKPGTATSPTTKTTSARLTRHPTTSNSTTTKLLTTMFMTSPTSTVVPRTTNIQSSRATLKQLIQQNNSHNTQSPVTRHSPTTLHSTKHSVSPRVLGINNSSSNSHVSFTPRMTNRSTRSSTANTMANHVTGQPFDNATDITTADQTSQKLATTRQKAITCAVCAGPPEACELAYYEDTCQSPDNYCINHVTNLMTGDRLVERKCGNLTECHNGWYMGTSDDDKCRQLSSSTHLTFRFECTFCCVTDSCNVDLRPRPDTLYTNA